VILVNHFSDKVIPIARVDPVVVGNLHLEDAALDSVCWLLVMSLAYRGRGSDFVVLLLEYCPTR
jgi:hypothetical protein